MTSQRTSLRLRRAGATLATGTLAAVAALALGPSPAATAAEGVTSLSQVDCETNSRLAQIRNNGTELWLASLARADSDTPTFYKWTKIYTFNQTAGAVAMISTDDTMQRMLVSFTDGSLRSYTWNTSSRAMTVKNLTPTDADKHYDFRRLTYDGTRLYGNRGTQLFVMTSISTTEAPKAKAKISDTFGYARSFFGNAATPNGELAWTDSNGTLRIGDIKSTTNGWTLTTRTVADKTFPEHTLTSPGGGILLRDLPSGDLWRHHLNTDNTTTSSHHTLATTTGAPDLPITTTPDVCKSAAPTTSVPGGPISRAEVLKRSQYWLDRQVPYSQQGTYRDPEGDQTYRTDCSGYTSMAWHTKLSGINTYWTGSLHEISTPIAWDSLKPGDAVNNSAQHVVIFVKWADSARTSIVLREHYSTPLPPRQTTRTVDSLKSNGFTPIRYDHIVD